MESNDPAQLDIQKMIASLQKFNYIFDCEHYYEQKQTLNCQNTLHPGMKIIRFMIFKAIQMRQIKWPPICLDIKPPNERVAKWKYLQCYLQYLKGRQ